MKHFVNIKGKCRVWLLAIVAILSLSVCVFGHNQGVHSFLGRIRFVDQRCVGYDGAFAFFNVNNADASLVYTNNEVGLIDTGLKETVGVILKEFEQLKINTLDFIVISHPHSDHAGGYLELIQSLTVKRLFIGQYSSKDFEDLSLYKEIIRVSNEKGIEIVYATYGLFVQIGDIGLEFYDGIKSSTDENHNSLLVKASIGDTKCLYTGDAGIASERYLMTLNCDLNADILKVGHHGSKTASSLEFLETVSPMYSVISVGYNDYGHPHQQTIEHLASIGTTVYRTVICDKILFEMNGNSLEITVE